MSKLPTVKLVKDNLNDQCVFNNTSAYANWSYNFAACSEIQKGKVKQLFSFHTCREGYVGSVMDLINGDNNRGKDYSTRKTTIMIWQHPGNDDRDKLPNFAEGKPLKEHTLIALNTGIKLANRFADEGGWLKSKLYRVELPKSTRSIVYVIEGSRWWSTAPQTLSLYLLLIRLGRRPELRKIKPNTPMKTIIKTLNKMSKGGQDDYNIVSPELWPVLIKNRATIFRNRKFSTNFAKVGGSTDGVKCLTLGDCRDDTIQKRFNEAKKSK